MEPKRTLHSGNLVRGVHAGDRNFNLEAEERFIKKLVDGGGELLDFKDRGQRRKL